MSTSDSTTKVCTACGTEYPATEEYFFKQTAGKYGLNSWCKFCHRERNRQNSAKLRQNPEYRERGRKQARDWYWDNLEYAREYNKQYYADNRERELERIKRNRIRFQAQRRQYNAVYHAEHREHLKEKQREWKLANPEKVRRYKKVAKARRRARIHANGGSFTAADVQAQYEAQEGRCFYCGITLHDKYHIDHYIPLKHGGSNWPENIVCACADCNLSKSDKLPWEFGRLLQPC